MAAYSGYTKQLGHQPGVQLTPVADAVSELVWQDISDQVTAIVARTRRGRIDRPVAVDRANLERVLGRAESNLVRPIHEARMQVSEILDSGAEMAVVSRLTSSEAKKKYAVVFLVSRIEQTFVSPLYPVSGFDSFDQSIVVSGGSMVGIDPAIDAFSHAFEIIGGGFPVTSYTSAIQALDSYSQSILIAGGSFPSVVITNSSASDSYSQSISLIGGGFTNNLIENKIVADGYLQSISINGGTLV